MTRRQKPGASIHLITAPLQAGRHGAVVIAPRAVSVPGGDTTILLGGIEAGLALRPVVALVFVGGLLVLRLTLLGIDDEVRRRLPLRRSLSVRASALGVGIPAAIGGRRRALPGVSRWRRRDHIDALIVRRSGVDTI